MALPCYVKTRLEIRGLVWSMRMVCSPPESSSLVCKLRDGNAALKRLAYESPAVAVSVEGRASDSSGREFDRKEYLRRSHEYFDDVKYAPLAALGLRFKRASLSEMYVTASADVGGDNKNKPKCDTSS
jgi:hypothetical protein